MIEKDIKVSIICSIVEKKTLLQLKWDFALRILDKNNTIALLYGVIQKTAYVLNIKLIHCTDRLNFLPYLILDEQIIKKIFLFTNYTICISRFIDLSPLKTMQCITCVAISEQ